MVAIPSEWDEAGALGSYAYGAFGSSVEQINNTTGAVTYLHQDQAGSTRLLTGSTGTVTGKCSYSAYGTPACEGSSTTPLGYDGEYASSDTGLVYMRARTYGPATAQFLSVDPLEKLTRAPYNFAQDNPLNESDPTGIWDWLGLGIRSPGEVLFPGGGSGQACIGGTISYGGVSVGLEGCYVHTPHGDGITITPSVTGGPGIGINVHAGAGESNACHVSEYGGPFSQLGGSAEFGTGGYYNRFSSRPFSEATGSRPVRGWTAGGTVGLGAEAGVGGSYTFTIPIGGEGGSSGSAGCGC
jgi:RHS repeat-associated protein